MIARFIRHASRLALFGVRWLDRWIEAAQFTRSRALSQEVVVSGFFSREFGLGNAARLTARQLELLGFEVICHDIEPLLSSRRLLQHSLPGRARDRTWIVQANAPEAEAAIARISWISRPRGLRLGYWAWELPSAPRGWLRAGRLFDTLLVPSGFVADAFENHHHHIVVLPHPAGLGISRPLLRIRRRKPFLFLVMADGRSSISRKNVLAAIRAFRKEFGTNAQYRLLVKLKNLSAIERRLVRAAVGPSRNVFLIEKQISASGMQRLFRRADCFVSPHRSEGFGLAIAEAILSGCAVLATGWSGNMEFMCADDPSLLPYRLIKVPPGDPVYGSEGNRSVWADIHVDELGKAMRASVQRRVGNTRRQVKNLNSAGRAWAAFFSR